MNNFSPSISPSIIFYSVLIALGLLFSVKLLVVFGFLYTTMNLLCLYTKPTFDKLIKLL